MSGKYQERKVLYTAKSSENKEYPTIGLLKTHAPFYYKGSTLSPIKIGKVTSKQYIIKKLSIAFIFIF